MNLNEMIQGLRAEITKLQEVLDLLLKTDSEPESVRRPGRPKGPGTKATSFNPDEFAPKKRTMSAEGKARIAAAQKKRWAAQKAAPIKSSSKRVSPKPASNIAPKTAKKPNAGKKSAGVANRTGPIRAKVQITPPPRKTSVAKKSAATKLIAKKASRPVQKRPVKRAAAPSPDSQATA